MLWNLAFKTLIFDRAKLIVGLVGVIFSVALVNIQGGLFLGLMRKASLLVDHSDADIWVGHHGMHNVDFAHEIPLRWMYRIRGLEGIARVEPMRIGFSEITLPDGVYESVVVVGIPRDSELGHVFKVVEGNRTPLAVVDGVVVDQCDDYKLVAPAVGDVREVGGQRVRIAAKSRGILSFLVAPYVFTTHDRATELTSTDPAKTSYFLVKVKPGTDKELIRRRIQLRLPDAAVLTAKEYSATSVEFWMTRTGIGVSFGAATLMGLLVGLVMVAQTLYAMVLDRVNEFATLKAIGSTDGEIVKVLFAQATLVAGSGIIIGTVISILAAMTLSTPRTEIHIPFLLYVASALLVLVICWAAAAIPYLRVRRISPHSVLQG